MILYRNCNPIPIFGENLLINPDFSINQRGLTEYKGHSVYCVDRWSIWNATVNPTNNGIDIKLDNDSSIYYELRQFIEININYILGKELSASISVNGIIYSITFKVPSILNTTFFEITKNLFNDFYLRIHINPENQKFSFEVFNYYKNSYTINWAKLELWSEATPFVPPNKAIELIKCKRYYQEILGEFTPYCFGENIIFISMKLDSTLRRIPTIKFKSNIFNEIQGDSENKRGVAMVSYWGGIHSGFTYSYFINGNEGNDARYVTITALKENHGCMNDAYFAIGVDNPLCLDAEIY